MAGRGDDELGDADCGGLSGIRRVMAMSGKPVTGIARIEGELRVNGKPAHVGELIHPGDQITTGAHSEAVFTVGDDAYLLRADSEVDLEGEGFVVSALNVVSGKILSVFGPGNMTIETPTATAGIRGTGAYVEIRDDHTYLCVCYGSADLRSKGAPEGLETVRTTRHESPRRIYGGGAETLIEEAEVVNHSDAELVMLEALLGREPPFGTENLTEGLYGG